jgi:uncharacterized protein (DUF362 family)
MTQRQVAVVRYQEPVKSVRRAVELCSGLEGLRPGSKVFIKPNIVFWTRKVPFPKWGVITTSRVVQDMVLILKEMGIDHITIGEGMVLFDPKDTQTPEHAFQTLGYEKLAQRYGVRFINVLDREYEKVDLGEGIELSFNSDFIHSDYVVNLPVLKTHAQTMVSLGIKNLKGMLNISSRKKCHSDDPEKDLHYMVSRLAMKIPPSFTLLDGIYTIDRGPAFDGKARRSDLLIASNDILSADMVGAAALGFEPQQIPHLVHAAHNQSRPLDLSHIEIKGERLEEVAQPHQWTFPYNEDETLPIQMAKMGIEGISYPKYDLTMCTYCSALTGAVLGSIAFAWKGQPWDNVEVLTGKVMSPTPGKKTILIGQCLYKKHKDHPNADNMTYIKTCPPSPEAIIQALHDTGVEVNPAILRNLDHAPGIFMKKYEGKPEFDESFFDVE